MVSRMRPLLDLHLRSRLAVLLEQPLVRRTLPAQVQDTVVGPRWCLTCGVNVLREQADNIPEFGAIDRLAPRAGVPLPGLDEERAVDLLQLRGEMRRGAGESEPSRQERVSVHVPPAILALAFEPRGKFNGRHFVVGPPSDAGPVTQDARAVPVADPHV